MAVGIKGLRVVAFDVFGPARGVVPDLVDVEATTILNGVSTATITVPNTGLAATRLKAPVEFAIEITRDGHTWVEPHNMRFLAVETEKDLVVDADTLKVSGAGFGHVLTWATVWEATAGNDEGKRVFNSQTPGAILHTLLFDATRRRDSTNLAWTRGALSWDFTPEHDSNGQPWGKKASTRFSSSATLAKPLDWLASKGAVDWRWAGRRLQVFNAATLMGRDLTSQVALRAAFSTAQPVKVSWAEICTIARFRGDGGYQRTRTNPDALQAFGRIERWSEQGQVTRDSTADLYLDEVLRRGEDAATQWRREYAATGDGPCYLVDYQLGDWVRSDSEKLRVVEAGIHMDAGGLIAGWDTLGTRLQSLLEKLSRRTTDLSDGAVGAESGAPTGAGEDTRTPAAPEGVVADSDVIVTEEGFYRGVVQVAWNPVTRATNGTDMQVSSYRIWTRRKASVNAEPVMRLEATVQGATSGTFYANPGDTFDVFVQAGAENGRWSSGSQLVPVAVRRDVTPPPQPSPPVLAARLGVVEIRSDGLSVSGAPMPADVERWEVAVSTTNPPPEVTTTQAVTAGRLYWLYAAGESGTYFVRYRAVDRAGNVGEWSAVEQIAVTATVDTAGIQASLDKAIEQWRAEREALDKKLAEQAAKQGSLEAALADAQNRVKEFQHAVSTVVTTWDYPPSGYPVGTVGISSDGRKWMRKEAG